MISNASVMRARGTRASSLTSRTRSASGASNVQKHDSSDGTYVEPRCATPVARREPGERGLEPGAVASRQVALHEVGRHRRSTIARDAHPRNNRTNLWIYSSASCGDASRELCSRADAELAIDLREVPRDRVRAEAELGGDLAVPASGDDELDDPPLGLRQLAVRCGAPADPPELRARLLRPEAGAEPLEDPGGLFERLASVALVLRPALHRSEREKRPRELEGVHSLRRLGRQGRRLERSDRPLAIALCGEEKSAAAEDERAESGVTVRCASIDLREQPLRPAKVAGRKQSLDPSRARQLGEVPVELLDVVEKRRDVPPARGGIVAGELEDRECDPQAKGVPSEPACLDDLEQFGDRSARSLGLTPDRRRSRRESTGKAARTPPARSGA